MSDATQTTAGTLERYVRDAITKAGFKTGDLTDEQRVRATSAPAEKGGLRGKALVSWIMEGKNTSEQAAEAREKQGTAAKAAKAAKPKAEPIKLNEATIKNLLTEYVVGNADADPLAPMHGNPFVQDGRVFMQLAGRGGTGRGQDVEAPTGFLPWLNADNAAGVGLPDGVTEVPKNTLRKLLEGLGFERKPFPYIHPERGSTAASYYSVPVGKFPGGKAGLKDVNERVGKRAADKAARADAKAAEPAPAPEAPEVESHETVEPPAAA